MAALLLVGSMAAQQPTPPAQQPAPPAGEPSAEELEKEFARAAEQFLALLESGDPEKFPDLCSEDGVVFGLDPPAVPLKQIRKEIENRTGVYCVLFDTACLRQQAAEQKSGKSAAGLLSVRERLRSATAREARIELTAVDELWAGDLQVELELPSPPPRRREVLEFSFERTGGGWRLIAIRLP